MKHDAPIKTDFKAFYKSPWGMAFIGYFVAMGLVGALTPPDILTAYSWTRPFTDFMASIVSQIDKVTALGIDPDIIRFYFSVMWAGSPVLCVFIFVSFWKTRHHAMAYKGGVFRMSFLKGAGIVAFAYLGLWAGTMDLFWLLEIKNRSFLTRATFGTSFGRLVMPQSFVAAPLIFLCYAPAWLIGWLTGYIPRNIRKQNELEKLHVE